MITITISTVLLWLIITVVLFLWSSTYLYARRDNLDYGSPSIFGPKGNPVDIFVTAVWFVAGLGVLALGAVVFIEGILALRNG